MAWNGKFDICSDCGRHRVYDCRTKERYCQYCRAYPPQEKKKEHTKAELKEMEKKIEDRKQKRLFE